MTEQKYVVKDVNMSAILNISRMIDISPHPLTKTNILKGMVGICGTSHVERGLVMAQQLEFIKQLDDKTYQSTGKFQEDFTKIDVDNFSIIAKKALQSYPPFILFIENLKKKFSIIESAKMIAGIFNLDSKISEKFFLSMATYAKILNKEKKLESGSTEKNDYVKNLEKSLNDETQAMSFILTMLSNEAYTFFVNKGVDFTRAAKALVEIKKDPKDSMFKIFEWVESCLYEFGKDAGVNVQKTNGIGQLINELKSGKVILLNPTHVGNGLAGLRNMTDHGVDRDGGKAWRFTEEAVLGISLLAIKYIKSIYVWRIKGVQEI